MEAAAGRTRLLALGLRSGRHTWSEEIYRCYGRDPALPPAVYPEVQQCAPESWDPAGRRR